MKAALKDAYARLRTVPVAGLLASRAVWALKGALGRPVAAPTLPPQLPPPSAPARRPPADRVDTRLQLALAAAQALSERLAILAPPPATPAAGPPATGAPPQSVSVIVSTLDRASWLDRALSALALQRHADFEVIVVAGPCRDGTAQVLVV